MLAPPTGEFRSGDAEPACRTPRPVPGLIVVSGVMARSPVADVFVRYGNTVTHASGMVMVSHPRTSRRWCAKPSALVERSISESAAGSCRAGGSRLGS